MIDDSGEKHLIESGLRRLKTRITGVANWQNNDIKYIFLNITLIAQFRSSPPPCLLESPNIPIFVQIMFKHQQPQQFCKRTFKEDTFDFSDVGGNFLTN